MINLDDDGYASFYDVCGQFDRVEPMILRQILRVYEKNERITEQGLLVRLKYPDRGDGISSTRLKYPEKGNGFRVRVALTARGGQARAICMIHNKQREKPFLY